MLFPRAGRGEGVSQCSIQHSALNFPWAFQTPRMTFVSEAAVFHHLVSVDPTGPVHPPLEHHVEASDCTFKGAA